jgi:hypothetical protein
MTWISCIDLDDKVLQNQNYKPNQVQKLIHFVSLIQGPT